MKIMVIDGNSILNRAFYGVRQLSNHEGLPTNAVYGFLATLFKLQDEEQPDRTVVCFDVRYLQGHAQGDAGGIDSPASARQGSAGRNGAGALRAGRLRGG